MALIRPLVDSDNESLSDHQNILDASSQVRNLEEKRQQNFRINF